MRKLVFICLSTVFSLNWISVADNISPELVNKVNRIIMDEIANGATRKFAHASAIEYLKKVGTKEAATAIKLLNRSDKPA